MHGIVKPRPTRVHFVDPAVPVGLESVTSNFLRQARTSALRHFEGHKFLFPSCFTLQCDVPGRADSGTSTGRIVAHVSPPVLKAWAAAASGTPAQRRAQVIVQLQLVLQDLSDHDVHVTLALTEAQCDVYGEDLVQLVEESLNRTTFCGLGRLAKVHWEGSLIRSLHPPFIVAVVSIGF